MKSTMKPKIFAALSALLMLSGALAPAAFADHHRYRGYSRYDRGGYGGYYNGRAAQHYSRQQYAKKGLIGAGAGAAIGGLMADEGDRAGAAVKGGLLGAGAGLGYEYLRRRW